MKGYKITLLLYTAYFGKFSRYSVYRNLSCTCTLYIVYTAHNIKYIFYSSMAVPLSSHKW